MSSIEKVADLASVLEGILRDRLDGRAVRRDGSDAEERLVFLVSRAE